MTETEAMQQALEALETLPKEDLPRVFSWLTSKLGNPAMTVPSNLLPSDSQQIVPLPGSHSSASHNMSAKAFLAMKKPKTDVERVACLAYYLSHHKNIASYKTSDISELNKEAAQPVFSNTAFAVEHATKQNKYLAPVGQGAKQITTLGEAVVDVLPDREKVKKALEEHSYRASRKRKANKAKKS